MRFTPLALPAAVLIEPRVLSDARGFFMETYRRQLFLDHGLPADFVQENHSGSARGVLRGLHFQRAPLAQGKLVRCLRGAIYDVGVDIRPDSPSFGRWVGERLDDRNRRLLYLPPGFAHGFLALEDDSQVAYKVTQAYAPTHDAGIAWNDPELAIPWPDPGAPLRLSDRDRVWPRLRDADLTPLPA